LVIVSISLCYCYRLGYEEPKQISTPPATTKKLFDKSMVDICCAEVELGKGKPPKLIAQPAKIETLNMLKKSMGLFESLVSNFSDMETDSPPIVPFEKIINESEDSESDANDHESEEGEEDQDFQL